ncbi:MAG: 16S rRNA (guanine(527)-N(7))-methyltransferase RsmG [Sphingobium sp.]
MTEDEARGWMEAKFNVSREIWTRLDGYITLLLAEMENQNLIATSTRDHIWARHIVDSAQLISLAPIPKADGGPWIDLGAGAGLPGMVVAILSDWPVMLVESRKGRVAFLQAVVESLALTNVTVVGQRTEAMRPARPAQIISARAYAPLPRLLDSALHLAGRKTTWILPKGKNWQNELEIARPMWQSVFHVEQSVTDGESAILVMRGIKKKGG